MGFTSEVLLNETTKVYYEIRDHNSNPYSYEESKKYVTVTYVEKTQTFIDGEKVTEKEPFEFGPCKKSYFNAEENKILVSSDHDLDVMLCPNYLDPNLYFQGTKESKNHGQKHVYSIVKVDRCDNKTSECASEKQIDKWLSGKHL